MTLIQRWQEAEDFEVVKGMQLLFRNFLNAINLFKRRKCRWFICTVQGFSCRIPKTAQTGQLSDIENSDDCGIINIDKKSFKKEGWITTSKGKRVYLKNGQVIKGYIGIDVDKLHKQYSSSSDTPSDKEYRQKKINEAMRRLKKYRTNWQKIDLDETITKFVPNAVPNGPNRNGKVVFISKDNPISIILDVNGRYIRIEDSRIKSKRNHLDINGNPAANVKENGKVRGRDEDEYEIVTHFKWED